MPLQIGQSNKFIVIRETDISYTLHLFGDEQPNDVFLHFNQATRKLRIDEVIDAFLYYDNRHRLCATMEQPSITTTEYGFVEVVGIKEGLGVFCNIGIAKDILLSTDYLPNNELGWPHIGDKVPCILRVKRDSLVCKLLSKEDLENVPHNLEVNSTVSVTAAYFTSTGIITYTDDFQIVYVHKSLIRKKYHIGERFDVTIINENSRGEYNGSTVERKEKALLSDSDIVLKYLNDFGGTLKLSDKSTPEEIARYFQLSKKAFKRAIGHLYKNQLIDIFDDKISLKK